MLMAMSSKRSRHRLSRQHRTAVNVSTNATSNTPEDISVEPRVPIADRTADTPVRDGPELAAGVIVMGQEIRKGMQETGTRKGAQDDLSAPDSQPEQPSPEKEAVVNRKDRLPGL